MSKQTIGEFLSMQRRAHGFTQEEIAEKLGVSNRTLSSWENDRTAPDIVLLPAIADLYGVTVDEILRGERQKEGTMPENKTISEKNQRRLLNAKAQKYRSEYMLISGGIFAVLCLFVFSVFMMFSISLIFGLVLAAFTIAWLIFLAVFSRFIESKAVAFVSVDDKEELTDDEKNYLLKVKKCARDLAHGICMVMFVVTTIAFLVVMVANGGEVEANFFFVAIYFGLATTQLSVAFFIEKSWNKTCGIYGDESNSTFNESIKKKLFKIAFGVNVIALVAMTVFTFVPFNVVAEVKESGTAQQLATYTEKKYIGKGSIPLSMANVYRTTYYLPDLPIEEEVVYSASQMPYIYVVWESDKFGTIYCTYLMNSAVNAVWTDKLAYVHRTKVNGEEVCWVTNYIRSGDLEEVHIEKLPQEGYRAVVMRRIPNGQVIKTNGSVISVANYSFVASAVCVGGMAVGMIVTSVKYLKKRK